MKLTQNYAAFLSKDRKRIVNGFQRINLRICPSVILLPSLCYPFAIRLLSFFAVPSFICPSFSGFIISVRLTLGCKNQLLNLSRRDKSDIWSESYCHPHPHQEYQKLWRKHLQRQCPPLPTQLAEVAVGCRTGRQPLFCTQFRRCRPHIQSCHCNASTELSNRFPLKLFK